MNITKTIFSLLLVVILAAVAFALVGYIKDDAAGGAKEEVGSTVIREGSVQEVDTTQAAVDGPVIVRIATDDNAIETILIPSMGLPLCAAFSNIDNAWNLSGGERIMVSGTLSADGSITPCTEESHYLKIESSNNAGVEGEVYACTLDAKICPDGSAVGRIGPNCEFAACPGESDNPTSADFKIGDSITLSLVRITPTEIITDSRCPIDVECIWEGDLEVLVQVEGHEHIFSLGETQNLEVHSITFVDASPVPTSTATIEEGEYTLTFSALLQ